MSSFSALIVPCGVRRRIVVYGETEHCNLLAYYQGQQFMVILHIVALLPLIGVMDAIIVAVLPFVLGGSLSTFTFLL
jgi:hypothetical protein